MGTTNQIKETNIGQALIGKECSQCHQSFTEKDICVDNNWEVEFDTSNDVQLVDNKVKGYGYNLTIWIRKVYHEDCPDEFEECYNCSKKGKVLGMLFVKYEPGRKDAAEYYCDKRCHVDFLMRNNIKEVK